MWPTAWSCGSAVGSTWSDDTTLLRWGTLIEPTTLAALNERVVELARSLQITRGRKLRVTSMVIETNIHHPTDSRLVGDGVHILSSWLRRSKRVLARDVPLPQRLFRFGWARCLAHGEAGLGRWVGWGILTANLVQMAHALVKRQFATAAATAA